MDKRLDATWLKHGNNVVFVMSPIVARVLVDLAGSVSKQSELIATVTDLVWDGYNARIEDIAPDEYIFDGDVLVTPFGEEWINEHKD